MTRPAARTALLAVLLTAATAGHTSAQSPEPVLKRVASAWHRGDVNSITALAADAGLSLNVDGSSVGPLGRRQAAAVLRGVFEDRESVSAGATMTRTVGGEPARAFGEIIWTTRVRGTTIPERATLFVAFVRQGENWRITEIRLMR